MTKILHYKKILILRTRNPPFLTVVLEQIRVVAAQFLLFEYVG